jgi:4-hydroxyphenylpyruvate dioxygenase
MKPSQLAINSVSTIRADLEESLAAYHAAGFSNVEFTLGHVKTYLAQGHTLADVRRLLDVHQLHCIGGFECGVESFSPAAQRAQNHALIVENARLLAELGGTNLVVGTDGPADLSAVKDPLGDLAKTFASLARQTKGTGVNLCIEFNWSPLVKSLRTAVEIARRSRAGNVGVLFDPAHYHCTPTKFEQLDADSVSYIKHVHVDDMADKPGELSNCNSDRVLPGQGCLDLKALFNRIEKHGYRGYFSIEMFSEKLWNMPARKAARLMYDSLLPLCKSR